MAHTLVFVADLISTGLTPNAKLFGVDGVQVGATIEAGIVETLPALYVYEATIADGQKGLFVIYDPADTTDRVGFSVDPKEGENLDATVSSRATPAQVASALVDYDPPTKAELDSAVSPLATAAALATVATYIDTEIATIITNLATVDTVVDGIAADVDSLSTSGNINILSVVDGDDITVYQSDTWSFSHTVGAGVVLTDYEALAFMVKLDVAIADASGTLYLRSDTGLVAIGGVAPVSAANGVLTIDSATAYTVLVHMDATSVVVPNRYTWWLKGLDLSASPDRGRTIATGKFMIKAHGVRAII